MALRVQKLAIPALLTPVIFASAMFASATIYSTPAYSQCTPVYCQDYARRVSRQFSRGDAVKVSESTDKIYEMCVADTKANLLEVFKKVRG